MAQFEGKFESRRQDWQTPSELFEPLHREFTFTCDVAASKDNAKCAVFFCESCDGLRQAWRGTCWMNPPYRQTGKWVKKAFKERATATTVCLVPARTNTNWWHDYCMKGEVRFLRGRPKFAGGKHGLPQPLAIVIFRRLDAPTLSPVGANLNLIP